jgi:hypothetical protein
VSSDDTDYNGGKLYLCTPEQEQKARRAAARNAGNADELIMFLNMLGVFPGQEHALRTTVRPR